MGKGESVHLAPQLILVIGGARSGKSTFAEQLAQRSGKSVAFIATATASDDEMCERIARHRASRPAQWHTIEEPLNLAEAVHEAANLGDVLLLDCITVWLANWLFAREQAIPDEALAGSGRSYTDALGAIDSLLQEFAALEAQKTLVIVTNEVGFGIVPAYASGRIYRDVLGLINQRLASAATRAYLMIAGLAVDIKRLQQEETSL